jgi:hypothetical protein
VDSAAARLRLLHQQAAARYAGIDAYVVQLRRREQVHGRDKPEELIRFKFRKQPWSVALKWIGSEGQGREVVYVKGQYENKIHTLLARGDMPFAPAGKRIALAPDSIFVRSASRHAITEAGLGNLIERFGQVLEATEKNPQAFGTLKYQGLLKRPEFEGQLEAAEQIIPPGVEPHLPRGGRRLWLFDPATHFPAGVLTWDDKSHEVEFYSYEQLQYPVQLDPDDFNPERLGCPKEP